VLPEMLKKMCLNADTKSALLQNCIIYLVSYKRGTRIHGEIATVLRRWMITSQDAEIKTTVIEDGSCHINIDLYQDWYVFLLRI
jgi:hypothetical protein